MGDKGNAFYRVVVAESRSPRDGKFIEVLGTYDPSAKTDKDAIKINKDVALSWIAKGAQATDTAKAVLVKAGVIPAEKFVAKPNAKPPVQAKIKKEKK